MLAFLILIEVNLNLTRCTYKYLVKKINTKIYLINYQCYYCTQLRAVIKSTNCFANFFELKKIKLFLLLSRNVFVS